MSRKLTVNDLDVKGKKILLRTDFNVPFDASGKISDDTRIMASLPTIENLIDRGAAVILMSHLGRPKGKRNEQLSLKPCARRLQELIDRPVAFSSDCVGQEAADKARALKPGKLLMLENLRFYKAEENPEEDPSFALQLAALGDAYVDDAFGCAHRPHASIVALARHFPDKAAAGFLLEKEIRFLSKALLEPQRPFYAIIGGAKISTKIGVLRSLLKKADALLIGGGMAYTFFLAQGRTIGNSIYEAEYVEEAAKLLKEYGKDKLFFPVDTLAAASLKEGAPTTIVEAKEGIPTGYSGVDIGPKTINNYIDKLKNAATVFWNGPLGVFEIPAFARGTDAVAEALAASSAVTIVGGGDSIAAIRKAGLEDKFAHLSTGGGAGLEYIEHGSLPGIDALTDAPSGVVA